MTPFEQEINENYIRFQAEWLRKISENAVSLHETGRYYESYRRIACMQAMKVNLVIPNFSKGSAEFFFEAHNDCLVSHVSASLGSWRTALQTLRSAIENVFCAIYFKDHPVELLQWSSSNFRLGFSELHAYASKHPDLINIHPNLCGLELLKEEYGTLSKAVHASAKNFRMTDAAGDILLWSVDHAKLGMWLTRETKVIEGIVLLMICLFKEKLTATKQKSLRDIMYYTISSTKRASIKSKLSIVIEKP